MCETCGKKTTLGKSIARRGLPKYKGGVGLKTTGITPRQFRPNVQRVRALDADGAVVRLKVCTKCLRAGRVRKPMTREIPEGLQNRVRAKAEQLSPEARRRAKKEAGDRRRKRRAEAAARVKKAKG